MWRESRTANIKSNTEFRWISSFLNPWDLLYNKWHPSQLRIILQFFYIRISLHLKKRLLEINRFSSSFNRWYTLWNFPPLKVLTFKRLNSWFRQRFFIIRWNLLIVGRWTRFVNRFCTRWFGRCSRCLIHGSIGSSAECWIKRRRSGIKIGSEWIVIIIGWWPSGCCLLLLLLSLLLTWLLLLLGKNTERRRRSENWCWSRRCWIWIPEDRSGCRSRLTKGRLTERWTSNWGGFGCKTEPRRLGGECRKPAAAGGISSRSWFAKSWLCIIERTECSGSRFDKWWGSKSWRLSKDWGCSRRRRLTEGRYRGRIVQGLPESTCWSWGCWSCRCWWVLNGLTKTWLTESWLAKRRLAKSRLSKSWSAGIGIGIWKRRWECWSWIGVIPKDGCCCSLGVGCSCC